jgi:hypothetical protein
MSENTYCCGNLVKTPFCPNCGNKAGTSPLQSLLSYVRGQAASMRRRADEDAAEFPGRKSNARYERGAAKWEAWRDALEATLSKESEHPHA